MIAVSQVGGIVEGDLKQMIKDNKLQVEAEGAQASANDKMYIKQAEHMLRSESYTAAANYVMKALEMNPESLVWRFYPKIFTIKEVYSYMSITSRVLWYFYPRFTCYLMIGAMLLEPQT